MRLLFALAAAALAAPAAAAPLTLDEALAAAVRGNADLAAARTTRALAGVDRYQSYSGILPRLDLAGAFGRQFVSQQDSVSTVRTPDGYAQEPVHIPASDYGSHSASLTLRWTIFDGLSSWRAISAASASARAASQSYDEASLRVAFDVTSRFYDAVKQERILKVRLEAAARSEELVRRADALYAAGRGTKADTFAARVNLGNDQIAVEAQRGLVVQARSALALAIGRTSDPDLEVVAPAPLAGPGLPGAEEPPPQEVLMARARKARPLVFSRQSAIEAADASVSQARGGYWPVLGLYGSYTRSSTDLGGPAGLFANASRQNVVLAQVTLAWNLFSGRQTAAAEQRAEVQASAARFDAGLAEQQVSAEITRARTSVVFLARAAALAQDALKAAEQGLALARERLEAGVANQLEVRDATQKLSEAQLTLTSALVDHAVARADLNRAVGGSL